MIPFGAVRGRFEEAEAVFLLAAFDADDPAFDAVALPADEVFDFVDPTARDLELPDDLEAVLFFADEPFDDELTVEREAADADFDFMPVDEDFVFDVEDFDPPDFDADDFAEPDLALEDFLVVAIIIPPNIQIGRKRTRLI